MKQETLNKRIEAAGLMTEDKYVKKRHCSTLYHTIKHSGSMKVYDNRFLNKGDLIFIDPKSLQVLLQALGMKHTRNFDTIDGIAEYYTYIDAREIKKTSGLTFKSEAQKLNHEAYQKYIERQNFIASHRAELENAMDYMYYGYGFCKWHKSHSHLSDEEAKIIWDAALVQMSKG